MTMFARHSTTSAIALLCAVALVGAPPPAVATTHMEHESPGASGTDSTFTRSTPTVIAGITPPGSRVVTVELAASASTAPTSTVRSSDDAAENQSRREIRAVAERRPGVHLAAVAEAVEEPVSTVRYHVRVLERDGLLETRKLQGKRRLFSAAVDSDRYELHAALADPPTARLLATTARLEPVGVTELAATLDRSPSTVSHHVDRLAGASLLEYDRLGRSVEVGIGPPVREYLEATPTGSLDPPD